MPRLTLKQRQDARRYLAMGYTAFVLDQDCVVPAWGQNVIERVLDHLDGVNRRYERDATDRVHRATEGA
jgi:hypothetical protein